uniref:LPS-assembly lipoprotein LptE n=1 Tax=Ningiella ruwaisensis TaxID=2364274 RepID=UPI00109F0A98|nr:LPS assembly lipoprotein LptE [Ningiella ruwaisensis]
MYRLKVILVCSAILCLSACGFKLRGSQTLPETIDTVIINSPVQYSPLSRALNERLPVYQLQGLSATAAKDLAFEAEQTVLLTLRPETLERRLLSVFSSGQVAEYELIYSVSYQVVFPGSEPLNNTMSVSREYQDDPQQILAKSRELDLITEEMRDEAADRIIRLLSNQYQIAQTRPLSPSTKTKQQKKAESK